MKLITFIKNSMPYNGGESATFEDVRADEYIAKGFAVEGDFGREAQSAVREALRVPATLEELEKEVEAAGYFGDAIGKIAKDRLMGLYGEEARYLGAPDAWDDAGEEISLDELRARLAKKTKAELSCRERRVRARAGEDSKKEELIDAIVQAAEAKAAPPAADPNAPPASEAGQLNGLWRPGPRDLLPGRHARRAARWNGDHGPFRYAGAARRLRSGRT
jgi:hypothetical protein